MRYLFLFLIPALCFAASPGATYLEFSKNGVPTMVYEDAVTPANSVGLPVSLVGGLSIGSVTQGSQGLITSPWFVEGTDGTNHASYTAGGAENVNITNSITATNPSVGATGSAVPASGTYLGANNGGNIVGVLVGQQTMANSLACVLPSNQSAIPVTGTFWQATQPVSGTFWQATQPVSGTVQVKASLNSTGSGSAAAATVSTAVTLTAPANAVGAFLMNLDTSALNIRWAVGRTASATLGQQLQPARDVWIPTTTNISICAESGTQNYDVQWISQ